VGREYDGCRAWVRIAFTISISSPHWLSTQETSIASGLGFTLAGSGPAGVCDSGDHEDALASLRSALSRAALKAAGGNTVYPASSRVVLLGGSSPTGVIDLERVQFRRKVRN